MKEWGLLPDEWRKLTPIDQAQLIAFERATAKMARYEAHLQDQIINKGKVTGGAA